IFRKLRQDGLAVLFITHNLREVLAVADRITVLRRGQVVSTAMAAGAREAELVRMLLGSGSETANRATAQPAHEPRSLETRPQAPTPDAAAPATRVLEIRDAQVPDPAGRMDLRDITLSIFPGEILGVAAVSGN